MQVSCVCVCSARRRARSCACGAVTRTPLARLWCEALARLHEMAHASLRKAPRTPSPPPWKCFGSRASSRYCTRAQATTPALSCMHLMHLPFATTPECQQDPMLHPALHPTLKPSLRPLHGHHARRQRRAHIRRRLLPVRAQAGMHRARLTAMRWRPRVRSPGRRYQALVRV